MRSLLEILFLAVIGLLLLGSGRPATAAIGCPTPTFKMQVVCLSLPEVTPLPTATGAATPTFKQQLPAAIGRGG